MEWDGERNTNEGESPPPDYSRIIRFDRGFTTARITMEEQFAFQAQQDEREQYQTFIQSQTQQESRAIREFEKQLEESSRRCPLYVVRHLPHRPHHI